MSYLTENEKDSLNNCETVEQMLIYLMHTFKLNIRIGLMVKIAFIKGLETGMNMIKPERK